MYKELPPSQLLAPYVDKYWEVEGETEYGMRVKILADGCTDFIFTLGDAFETVKESLTMQAYRSYFIGPMHTYSELVACSDSVHMLGVRFLPCGLSRFMKLPLDEMADMRLEAPDINNLFTDSFAERLAGLQDFRQRISLVESFLIKNLYRSGRAADAQILFAVEQINGNKGNLPIQNLVEDICLCKRQFERKFKMHTGFSPKKYSSIVKFRNAIDLLRNAPFENLLSVAVQAGYYDVSHFSRDVKNLSGATPLSFLSLPPESELSLIYME